MKRPKTFPVIKMPQTPGGHAFKAGQATLAQFAHHAPTIAKTTPRMSRPGHAKGPHN